MEGSMTRKIIGAAFVSLDGVMQAPGAPEEDRSGGFEYGGWLAEYGDEVIDEAIGGLFDGPFDLLLGRRTYDIFASYWPYQSMDNPIAAAFAKCGKFVLTRSDAPLEWQGSHRLADTDALAALKETDGPDLVIQGSSTLYPQLLQRGLLDRLVLLIAPVAIGQGKRLFGEGTPAGAFKAVEQKIGSRGCMMAALDPAGPLKTGSFVTTEPSEPEMSRRAKVAEGTW
jgi:dihydrofolate reductase